MFDFFSMYDYFFLIFIKFCTKIDYLSILSKFDVNAKGIEHSRVSVEKCISEGLEVGDGTP